MHSRGKTFGAMNRVEKIGRRDKRRGETSREARNHDPSGHAEMVSAARADEAVGRNARNKMCKARSKVKVSSASAVNARKADAESVAVAVVDRADAAMIVAASARGVIVMNPSVKDGHCGQVVLKDKSGRNDRRDPSGKNDQNGATERSAQNAERDRNGQIARDKKLNVRNANLNRRRHPARNRQSQRL